MKGSGQSVFNSNKSRWWWRGCMLLQVRMYVVLDGLDGGSGRGRHCLSLL